MRFARTSIRAAVAVMLLLQLVSAGPKSRVQFNLDNLCNDVEMDFPVRGLDALLSEFDEIKHNCPAHVKSAMLELKSIIDDERACSMEKAEAIVKFANDYLRESPDDADGAGGAEESKKIPKALARLAVSYGMQVSDKCQSEAVTKFIEMSRATLSISLGKEKLDALVKYSAQKSPLSFVLSPIVKRSEVVLPEDLFAVLPGLEAEVESFLANNGAARTKSICASHFEPLYGPMLLPLAHLQRAGFHSGPARVGSKARAMVTFWTEVTFVCETLKMSSKGASDPEKAQLIEELAADLEHDETATKTETELVASCPVETSRVTPYQSKTLFSRNDVLKADQTSSRVVSFDANKSELERLRERIASRSFDVFKMMSRKGSHKAFFKKLLRVVTSRKDSAGDLDEASEGLVELMHAKEGDSVPFKVSKGLKFVGLGVVGLVALVLRQILKSICVLIGMIFCGGGTSGGPIGITGQAATYSLAGIA